MKFLATKFLDAHLIQSEPQWDERGYFARTFSAEEFAQLGLESNFVQHSTSFSANKGTLRGMHYQEGGGLSLDGTRWISCRPGFLLPVRVLSHLFRRLFLEALRAAFDADSLKFFRDLAGLAEPAPSPACWPRSVASHGSSTPSRPSEGSNRCWPISAATPIAVGRGTHASEGLRTRDPPCLSRSRR
jgi:hypothetical protein